MFFNLNLMFSFLFLFFLFKIWYVSKALLLLLTVEFLNIILFIALYDKFYMDCSFYVMSLIFISFCVTEGVLGLCIFIKMTRSYGEDFTRSMKKNIK